MPSRRKTLAASGSVLISSLAGCFDVLENDAAVRKVEVRLVNGTDESHVFHITLETETEVQEWDSYTIDANTNEWVEIDSPDGAFPVALHGAVGDFADTETVLGLDEVSNDFCLQFSFWYQAFFYGGSRIEQYAGIGCE